MPAGRPIDQSGRGVVAHRNGSGATGPWHRALQCAVLALGAAYGLTLVPGARDGTGYVAPLDGWANNAFVAGIIALLVLRGAVDRPARAAWPELSAGAIQHASRT